LLFGFACDLGPGKVMALALDTLGSTSNEADKEIYDSCIRVYYSLLINC